MPTGYTEPIYNNKPITFEEFILRCARAMGALIMIRDLALDSPIPEEIETSTHHLEKIKEIDEEILKITILDPNQCAAIIEDEYCKSVDRKREMLEESEALRARYTAMRAKVVLWEPPTGDHTGLKDFMLKQLDESLRFDCSTVEQIEKFYTITRPESPGSWRFEKLKSLKEDRQGHIQRHANEVAQRKDQNNWLADLRASLEDESS